MSGFVEVLVAVLIVAGAAFAFLGSLGLARFPDFYMRLHGPSKATTLGIGCLLLASLAHFALRGEASLHEVLITLFVSLTTPVSAHLLARAARHRRLPARGESGPAARVDATARPDAPSGNAPR
ncbi:MAG: Na+/H+ antiporter subunit G [Steroidobacteraceae bacterium]|jgi:multicomponent K+:H+ antiporter subunit G|nr:Na+/H+ antiporter subunit G [Steroidobacteraceae bacterium]